MKTREEFEAEVAAIRRQERNEIAKEIFIRLVTQPDLRAYGEYCAGVAFGLAEGFLSSRDKV